MTAGAAVVREPTVLDSLSVRAAPGVDLERGIAGLGRVDADGRHVWLSITALRARAIGDVPSATAGEWAARFEAMVEYATAKGWTSADGSELRAHLTTAE